MDTISLKKYIFENNKTEYILQEIGCNHIQYHPNKNYFSCSNYNGDNQNAINVKNNEYLNVINWTREKEFGDNSDIITLVQYNKGMSFVEAVKFLHRILGVPYEFKRKEEKVEKKYDPLHLFKRIANKRKMVNVGDIQALEDELLNDFVPMLHIDWYREGIMPWARDRFKLAYSYRRKRVVIPIHHWLTKELVGFNMRTTVPNYDEFGISKYWITPTYQKSNNLYGLAENYDSIIAKKIVTVFESEKSTLKRFSVMDDTCVSLQGKTMSDEQTRILIGLDSEIVLALDKDVDINEVRHICEKFYRIRPVSYIYDQWDLLDEKDSPADQGDKIFKFLFEHRVKYDDYEHKKYQESLKK